MADPETEKEKSSVMLDSLLLSDCVSKLQLSPLPSVTKEQIMLSMPDWSLLPVELLHIISMYLENCFDLVHARSVCRLWRSTFPFPSYLLRPSYSLPTFNKFPLENEHLCTLEKVPLFLFRVLASPVATAAASASASTSEYFLGGIGRDESEDGMELPSPIQCSVKVMVPGSDPTIMNMLDCQILPLGHQYRMIDCNPKDYRGTAFLPLKNEGGGEEFIVLLNYTRDLLVLRSADMRWKRLKRLSDASCWDLVTFKGKFYAGLFNNDIFVIDPYTLDTIPLRPLELLNCGSCNHLVPSGNDELFLVEKIIPRNDDVLDFGRLTLRVCKLDEEACQWVVVSDIGDRLLFIGDFGNFCCSAKELPDGCGLSGNSIVYTNEPGNITYTNEPGNITYSYKYGVHTGRQEDDLNCWRYSREKRVTILSTSPVATLRVEAKP